MDNLLEYLLIGWGKVEYFRDGKRSVIHQSSDHWSCVEPARAASCRRLIPIWDDCLKEYVSLRVLVFSHGICTLWYDPKTKNWKLSGHPKHKSLSRRINGGTLDTMSYICGPYIQGEEIKWVVY